MSQPIEWYRSSPVRGVLLVATVAFFTMMIGVFLLAFGLDSTGRINPSWQPWLLSSGMCVVILGVSMACYGFFFVLSKEGVSLVLRRDGLLHKTDADEHFYDWQHISAVDFSAGTLTISVDNQASVQIVQSFSGISGADLAHRIADVQRKALLGTIR